MKLQQLKKNFTANPGQRAAQKALAKEVTTLVHGEAAYHQAVKNFRSFIQRGYPKA